MKRICGWMALIGCGAVLAGAQAPKPAPDSTGAVERAMTDTLAGIETESAALIRLRQEIDAEREPLAKQMAKLRKTVAERRGEAERIRRLRREGEKEYAARAAEVEAGEGEFQRLRALLSEYARSAGVQAPAAEGLRISDDLKEVRAGLETEDRMDEWADLAGRLLESTARWNERRLGGDVFEGTALASDGTEHAGRFIALGPAVYFRSEPAGPAGMAIDQFGTPLPVIHAGKEKAAAETLRRVLEGKETVLPMDVTGGDVLRLEKTRTGCAAHIRKGGFVMIPLLGLGALALVLAIWKAVELRKMRVAGGDDVRNVLVLARAGRRDEAERAAAAIPAPLGALAAELVRHADMPRDQLEEILHEHVLGCLPRMERFLGALAVLGGVAPLLGLLGTVTGMIHTFQLVTVFGSGDAKLLSGGISEALVTTEFGLIIAIPVLLIHAVLVRRTQRLAGELEQTVVQMADEWMQGR